MLIAYALRLDILRIFIVRVQFWVDLTITQVNIQQSTRRISVQFFLLSLGIGSIAHEVGWLSPNDGKERLRVREREKNKIESQSTVIYVKWFVVVNKSQLHTNILFNARITTHFICMPCTFRTGAVWINYYYHRCRKIFFFFSFWYFDRYFISIFGINPYLWAHRDSLSLI